jgi:uracil DNA glycosylase
MLNSALTTTIGKPNSHIELWRPMMAYVLDYLKIYNPGLCYILMGRTSEQLIDYLSEKDPLFILTHPMNAISLGKKKWPCDDVFRKVSEITKKNYNFDIKW